MSLIIASLGSETQILETQLLLNYGAWVGLEPVETNIAAFSSGKLLALENTADACMVSTVCEFSRKWGNEDRH